MQTRVIKDLKTKKLTMALIGRGCGSGCGKVGRLQDGGRNGMQEYRKFFSLWFQGVYG